jgi:DNA-binding beta-propeller fold protein YncE
VACTNFVSDGEWGEGRVDVVDLSAGQVIASVPVGRNPRDIVRAPDGRLHVLCTGTYGRTGDPGGSVHVLDPVARADVDSIALGNSPTRIATDETGTMWAVGPTGGVRRWDATTLALLPAPTDAFLLGPGLSAIDVDPDRDAVWITHFDEDLLLEVDPSTLEIRNAWLVGDGPVDVLSHDPAGALDR